MIYPNVMILKNTFLAISVAVLTTFCTPPAVVDQEESVYFSIDSLITAQLVQMGDQPVSIHKTVEIDGLTETQNLQLDTAQLRRELTGLADFDLQKPGYQGVFDITQTGNTTIYKAFPEEKVTIRELKIEKDEQGNVASIYGKAQDDQAQLIYTTCQVYQVFFLIPWLFLK